MSSSQPGFFQSPLIPNQPNPEPPGFDLLRYQQMMNYFQNQQNPWGMTPYASGPSQLNPYGGRGQFNPYQGGYGGGYGQQQYGGGHGGGYGGYSPYGQQQYGGGNNFGQFVQGNYNPGGNSPGMYGGQQWPGQGGGWGGYGGGGGGQQSPWAQYMQQFFNRGWGPGVSWAGNQGPQQGGTTTVNRQATPEPAPAAPTPGGTTTVTRPPSNPANPNPATPEPSPPTPISTPPTRTVQARYDGQIGNQQPYPHESSPMPYDGATQSQNFLLPILMQIAAQARPPQSQQLEEMAKPDYDGCGNTAYGGVRAPMGPHIAKPRPTGGRPMSVAGGMNRMMAGMGGATHRGMMQSKRVGKPNSVYDGTPVWRTGSPPPASRHAPPTVPAVGRTAYDAKPITQGSDPSMHASGRQRWWQPAMQWSIPNNWQGLPQGTRPDWANMRAALGPGVRGRFNWQARPAPWAPGNNANEDFQALPNQPQANPNPGHINPNANLEAFQNNVRFGQPDYNVSEHVHDGDTVYAGDDYNRARSDTPAPSPGPQYPQAPPGTYADSPGSYTGGNSGPMQQGGMPQGQQFPTGAQNLGAPLYPWLMPWQGQFTAPMSPYEQQGLGGMSNFVGGGMGLGQAQQYNQALLGGQYIGEANPYMNQIQGGMQSLKDFQDQQAQKQIASSMAAGGNALSGARASAESQYQNLSNANFNQNIGNMRLQDLARERALQNQGVGQAMGLSNTQMGGYGNLMQAGALPRQLQQNDINSQYGDWLRQIGSMNQQNQYQNQLANQMLHSGYPGSAPPNYGQSSAAGWGAILASLLGGNGGGNSTIGNLLKSLFGGGGSGKTGGGGGGGGQQPGGGGQRQGGNAPAQPQGDVNPTGDTDSNGNPIMSDDYGNVYGMNPDGSYYNVVDYYGDGNYVPLDPSVNGGWDPNAEDPWSDPSNWGGDQGFPNYGGGDYGGGDIPWDPGSDPGGDYGGGW